MFQFRCSFSYFIFISIFYEYKQFSENRYGNSLCFYYNNNCHGNLWLHPNKRRIHFPKKPSTIQTFKLSSQHNQYLNFVNIQWGTKIHIKKRSLTHTLYIHHQCIHRSKQQLSKDWYYDELVLINNKYTQTYLFNNVLKL